MAYDFNNLSIQNVSSNRGGNSYGADNSNGAIYWVGTDGNIWLKQNGEVKNMGKALRAEQNGFDSATTSMYATKIDDPNPGGVNNQTSTNNTSSDNSDSSSSASSYYARLAAQQAAENARKAAQAQSIKDSMTSKRSEFENILNTILGNINSTYEEEANKRKQTYDEDAAALLDTLEKALPEIASSFASIGAYDSSLRGYREMDAEKEEQDSQKDLTEEYDEDMANLGNKANQARVEAQNSYNDFMTDFDTLNDTEANADNLETIRSSQNSLLKGLNDFSAQGDYYKPNSTFANEMKELGTDDSFENIASSLANFLSNAGAGSASNFQADKNLSNDTKETTDKVKTEVETNKATGASK